MSALPYPVPPLATARRLEWQHLPPYVRALVEQHCGSPVALAQSQDSGFTPGFASVLTCEDGTRHFVKAASRKAQRPFAEAYRVEARRLRALPPEVPSPRLRWVEEDEDWVVLSTEYVAATPPARPWEPADLDASLDALEVVARELTPAPATMGLDTFADDMAGWPAYWEGLEVPDRPERAAEAATLAAGFADHVAGDTVVHTDLRADNTLVGGHGEVWFCDWNWPCTGADWLDSLLMLVGPRGDGLDVESVLATRPLLRDVPAEAVDSVLALVTGYFLHSATEPVPPTSPHLRAHQRWQGEVCWEWLCERRGWA